MTDTPDDVRKRLASLAEDLEALSFPTSHIRVSDAHWLAAAFRQYLSGNAKSMDAALGLQQRVGAPPKETRNKLVAQHLARNTKPMTYEKLADELQSQYPEIFPEGIDTREIRRIVGTKRRPTPLLLEALGEEVARRLSS